MPGSQSCCPGNWIKGRSPTIAGKGSEVPGTGGGPGKASNRVQSQSGAETWHVLINVKKNSGTCICC